MQRVIGRLTNVLQNLNIQYSAEDIVDWIWLAAYQSIGINKPPISKTEEGSEKEEKSHPTEKEEKSHPTEKEEKSHPTEKEEKSTDEKKNKSLLEEKLNQEPKIQISVSNVGDGDSILGGIPFRAPSGRALPHSLQIMRALRPLIRRVHSKEYYVLDEDITAQTIAETNIWIPVFKPENERWLDLALVVDDSPSMRLWYRTINELHHILTYQGAFRDVRLWYLKTYDKNQEVSLYTQNSLSCRNYKELINTTKSRLILLLSDCVSPIWHSKTLINWLNVWSQEHIVSLIHMLPQSLWSQTHLNKARWLQVKSNILVTSNRYLKSRQTPFLESFDDVPIPLTILRADVLSDWAKFISGNSKIIMPAFVLKPNIMRVATHERIEIDDEVRFQRFRAVVSPNTFKLACFFAAVPLRLPIMRLVQSAFVPESGQTHLAEFFLSGLIKRVKSGQKVSNPDDIDYDFLSEKLRDKFLNAGLITDTIKVQTLLSDYIEDRYGYSVDFQGIILSPGKISTLKIGKELKPFAYLTAKCLRRLGKKYSQAANFLEGRIVNPDRIGNAQYKDANNDKRLDLSGNPLLSELSNIPVEMGLGTLIASAIAAGTAVEAKNTTSQAIKDDYSGLRSLVQKWFSEKNYAKGEMVLTKYKDDPDTWKKPLIKALTETDADKSVDIIAAVEKLQKALETTPGGLDVLAKYNLKDSKLGVIGDKITINGNVINTGGGDVHQHYYQDGQRSRNQSEILSTYRNQLISTLQHIPLRGIDTEPSDPSGKQKRLELDRVYVSLDTTSKNNTVVEKEKARSTVLMRPISALEAAASNRSLVILGDPGSGKSTFVNHLTICLSRNDMQDNCSLDSGWPKSLTDLIPIPVVIRDFAQWISEIPERAETRHLWEFISERLKRQMMEGASGVLKDALDNGKAIVLLDGLDEVPTTEKRTFIRDVVAAFEKRYSKSRFIVTCRVLSYQNPNWQLDRDDFPVFELAAFDEHKIDAFIRAWYEDLKRLNVVKTQEETDELIRRLKTAVRRRDLWRLAATPLLLTVMALVHTHKGRLPDARALLYEETVEILLWRWEQVKTSDQKSKPGLKELLLEVDRMDVDLKKVLWGLAFEAHGKSEHAEGDPSETVADISEWDLCTALAKLHPEKSKDWASHVIEIIKLRAGLLLERTPGVYTFPHRTFQEYLAGAYLSTQSNFSKQASSLIETNNLWREVVLSAVGRLVYVLADSDKPLALVGELCPTNPADDDISWCKVWIAGEVLAEIGMNRVQDSSLGKDLLKRLRTKLTELLQKGRLTPKERVAAGNALSRLGDPRFDPDNWYLPVRDDMGFVTVPAGTFLMGSDREKDSYAMDRELPQHSIELSEYAIGKYPVTVAAFRAFVHDSGYQPEGEWEDYSEYENHPVVNVSWNDAVKYCEWLTEKLKSKGLQVSLPTEAQWEKAACGPKGSIYPYGNELDLDQANCGILGKLSPVGAFPDGVSFYGAEDMAGNILEWCHDWFDEYYYTNSPSVDPFGPDTGSGRVVRGCSWGNRHKEQIRSAYREVYAPSDWNTFIGFRLALFSSQVFQSYAEDLISGEWKSQIMKAMIILEKYKILDHYTGKIQANIQSAASTVYKRLCSSSINFKIKPKPDDLMNNLAITLLGLSSFANLLIKCKIIGVSPKIEREIADALAIFIITNTDVSNSNSDASKSL